MMTMQLDMTAELMAIPYGLAVAVAVSFVGILVCMSRSHVQNATAFALRAYQRSRATLRRHLRAMSHLPSARAAH